MRGIKEGEAQTCQLRQIVHELEDQDWGFHHGVKILGEYAFVQLVPRILRLTAGWESGHIVVLQSDLGACIHT